MRFIASRSLRQFPGYEGLEFEFDDTRQDRILRRRQAMEIGGRQLAATQDFTERPATLIDLRRGFDGNALARIAAQRDDTPITLEE